MRSINAKKIAAVVTGAALLGAGLAFAGPVTFQNVPIISNSGQPVVQIVVGSKAWPSDGIAAANIAAAIGNLAYTSVPVTAQVNANSTSNLGVTVSSAKWSLTNQQVWLNESGTATATGSSYLFTALIGSVLNQGVQLGASQNTKALQGSGSYTFPEALYTTNSPIASPYSASGSPSYVSVSSSSNGGGVSFTSGFTSGGNDNILQVSSSEFSQLKQNYGGAGETEYLYLTGFPVYNQQTSVKSFQVVSASGAYQIVFNKPIVNRTSGGAQINYPIYMLGNNYTIINGTGGGLGSSSFTTSQVKAAGSIYLASSLAPLQTVYVGHNITSGPWTVQLQDLGQPNSNGVSPASVAVFYAGTLTNTSSITPGTLAKFNVSGKLMYLDINQTFAGLYSYQKWAKMELYTNVYKLTNSQEYNSSTDQGWRVNLLWTNTTTAGSSAKLNQLYSIVVYNTSPTSLSPGQSISFIQNPSAYKLTFLGDTLGSGSFDSVTLSTAGQYNQAYQNKASAGSFVGGSISNITEPIQPFTVQSSINNAFSYAGQTGSTILYDLTPYMLVENANTVSGGFGLGTTGTASNVILTYTDPSAAATSTDPWLGPGNPLTVYVSGYTQSSAGTSFTTESALFTYNTTSGSKVVANGVILGTPLYNITSIEPSRALPVYKGGSISFQVDTYNTVVPTNTLTLATLANTVTTPEIVYSVSGQQYQDLAGSTQTATYNQQNGQPTTTWSIQQGSAPSHGTVPYQVANFSLAEVAVPSNTAAQDTLGIGIYNNTAGVVGSPTFIVNYSLSGLHNNVSYIGSSYVNNAAGNTITAQTGFRTERGSKVASITSTQDTLDIAEAVDWLQFAVSSSSSNATVSKSYSTHGPYGIGQATNIPNVSIAKVNASIQLSGSSGYTITGVSNLTATPSVTSATTPVWLNNLPTSPLVVQDNSSALNSGSNLILIGSGYVNSLSKQLEQSYNITADTTPGGTPVVQAYGTNRILVAGYAASDTTSAANSFITQLYAAASK